MHVNRITADFTLDDGRAFSAEVARIGPGHRWVAIVYDHWLAPVATGPVHGSTVEDATQALGRLIDFFAVNEVGA